MLPFEVAPVPTVPHQYGAQTKGAWPKYLPYRDRIPVLYRDFIRVRGNIGII